MPEQLPNQVNTTGSYAPTPQDPLEVTPRDIAWAGAEDIRTAALDYLEQSRADMANSNNGQRSQEIYGKRIKEANSTMFALIDWKHSNDERLYSNQLTETFSDFLNRVAGEDSSKPHLDDAYNWVGSSSYNGLVGKAIQAKPQESLESASTETIGQQERPINTDTDSRVNEQAEQKLKETNEASAREAVEKARGVEIFDDIVQFAKDKTYLHTDIKGGFTDLGDIGRQNTGLQRIPKEILQEARKNPDYRQHLSEAVMFSGLTETDKRTVTKERQVKGRFGRSTTETYTDTEVVPNSKHPVMIHNEQTGQDEPSIRFRYNFKYSDRMSVDDERALPPYQEFQGGRSGQTIQASVDLPESIANKLKTQIEEDPSSVRELVEKLFLNNHDGRMTEEYWRKGGSVGHPVRPPYEKLPVDWTIGVIDDAVKDNSQGYQVQRLAVNR